MKNLLKILVIITGACAYLSRVADSVAERDMREKYLEIQEVIILLLAKLMATSIILIFLWLVLPRRKKVNGIMLFLFPEMCSWILRRRKDRSIPIII